MNPWISGTLGILCTTVLLACAEQNAQKPEPTATNSPAQATTDKGYNIDLWPKLSSEVASDPAIEAKVTEILAKMTLEQKIAQMIQPEIRDISVEDMRKYGFGSYLNGGGSFPSGNKQATPADWIDLAEAMYQASMDDSLDGIAIPTMWGTDAVHGHNNVIGATLFPHNIGLGAMNNPELIEKIAEITATEVMVTGIDWVFAPTVAVVRDDRWGRTYEGYSEHPDIVRSYSAAIVKGLQGRADKDFLGDDRVISTVKHFVGDGGTVEGDDQGNNIASEKELVELHAQGYVGGLSAGAQSVMASFNSWHGEKIHGHKYLLNDVLKERMGFDGFVVGDWNGHGQVAGCSNESCAKAINAGLDMFMAPTPSWKPLYYNTLEQAQQDIIPMSRIDDAVARILRVKLRAGLFEKPSPANRAISGQVELIGHADHRQVAKQAVRESLVLLKNQRGILPLPSNLSVLVAGDGANNIGKQSGGWTITWQGTGNTNADFPGATSIYDGIVQQVTKGGGTATLSEDGSFQQKPDVAIVVFGESPYAEGHGDRPNVDYQIGDKRDLALLQKLKAQGIPVISLFISGRPLWVNAELNASDAFVAVWLPGSEGDAIAQVLFRDTNQQVQYDFVGKLSFSWPKTATQTVNWQDEDYQPLLPYGFGLTYQDDNVLGDDLDETYHFAKNELAPMPLFNGTMQKPWLLWLTDEQQKLQVQANSAQLGSVGYRTIDKEIQEDAFKVAFSGGSKAAVSMISKSNFREDLRVQLIQESALVFGYRVDTKPSESVALMMYCEAEENQSGPAPQCQGGLDITEQLSQAKLGEWQTLAVDMGCFKEAGMQLANTVSPFSLETQGTLELALADVTIQPQKALTADIRCSGIE
ncbi:glycoside hydrolase family 3 protein [Paraferrimonas haliotis]|uniref:1,4-beta-D-glucan glucohydrolase n=1 Tax=Paraferrimonas haliotis TaxID=2013866 RepID=A0AA37TS22_9GAMM|nr:exo 1,3/1,4-beta-D-glucan glucohydrolase [Paraferrimonas haliotis]GLS83521.1 1,4-beta-D-glucan glucohydrolase [Paraferrimonas haliotis]